jgi:hypothetical protein
MPEPEPTGKAFPTAASLVKARLIGWLMHRYKSVPLSVFREWWDPIGGRDGAVWWPSEDGSPADEPHPGLLFSELLGGPCRAALKSFRMTMLGPHPDLWFLDGPGREADGHALIEEALFAVFERARRRVLEGTFLTTEQLLAWFGSSLAYEIGRQVMREVDEWRRIDTGGVEGPEPHDDEDSWSGADLVAPGSDIDLPDILRGSGIAERYARLAREFVEVECHRRRGWRERHALALRECVAMWLADQWLSAGSPTDRDVWLSVYIFLEMRSLLGRGVEGDARQAAFEMKRGTADCLQRNCCVNASTKDVHAFRLWNEWAGYQSERESK